MARLLIITTGFPDDLTSGRHLRVHHLCRELARENELCLVDLSGQPLPDEGATLDLFSRCEVLDSFPAHGRSWRRHFRLHNASLLQLSFPDYFRRSVAEVGRIALDWRADGLISFAPGKCEISAAIDLPRIIDIPDSITLTTERTLTNRGHEMPLGEWLALRIDLPRRRAGERHIVRAFDYTLSISRADRQRLLELSGVASERIVLLPNGVAPEALAAWREHSDRPRRIVFWGNLDFPPNWTAVRYFHDRVFIPHLADRGVEWEILGRNANEAIQALARHPRIHLGGFQEHLFEHVADAGVMVNPMVEGSGLKNKVLEAFAVGLPVVTTHLGVDALAVQHGRECLITDDPRAFADSILRLLDEPGLYNSIRNAARARVEGDFSWARIGADLNALVSLLLTERATATLPARV